VRRHRGRLRAGPLTGVQATGVLVFNYPSPTPAGTSVDHNTVYGNDLGIYTDDRIVVSPYDASRNRYIGIFADSDARGATVVHNTADAMTTPGHGYGIYVNANHGNTYANNQAAGTRPTTCTRTTRPRTPTATTGAGRLSPARPSGTAEPGFPV